MKTKEELREILSEFEKLKNPANVEGMARFGINPDNAYGINMPVIRKMAKQYRKNHPLALELWKTGIHEAKIMAALVDVPQEVTPEQMDQWASEFDSWDVCDQVCMNLFDKSQYARTKIPEWAARDEEFVKRSAFSLIASLAVHEKNLTNYDFAEYLEIIKKGADDDRNFVKKAVNWALRGIGKRNDVLREMAITAAEEILTYDSKAAKWIARGALKELKDENTYIRNIHL
jgi:3-methyladenine DNA glycosylase AlkD